MHKKPITLIIIIIAILTTIIITTNNDKPTFTVSTAPQADIARASFITPDTTSEPLELVVLNEQAAQRAAAEEAARIEAARIEADRLAAEQAARQRAAIAASTPVAPPAQPQVAQTSDACDGIDWVIPVYIVWRESHCDFGAINYNGCGGYTCVGAYQFDLRHWIPRDQGGWGACAWLGDWHIPQNQIECARQMSRDGTYLAPWGG